MITGWGSRLSMCRCQRLFRMYMVLQDGAGTGFPLKRREKPVAVLGAPCLQHHWQLPPLSTGECLAFWVVFSVHKGKRLFIPRTMRRVYIQTRGDWKRLPHVLFFPPCEGFFCLCVLNAYIGFIVSARIDGAWITVCSLQPRAWIHTWCPRFDFHKRKLKVTMATIKVIAWKQLMLFMHQLWDKMTSSGQMLNWPLAWSVWRFITKAAWKCKQFLKAALGTVTISLIWTQLIIPDGKNVNVIILYQNILKCLWICTMSTSSVLKSLNWTKENLSHLNMEKRLIVLPGITWCWHVGYWPLCILIPSFTDIFIFSLWRRESHLFWSCFSFFTFFLISNKNVKYDWLKIVHMLCYFQTCCLCVAL